VERVWCFHLIWMTFFFPAVFRTFKSYIDRILDPAKKRSDTNVMVNNSLSFLLHMASHWQPNGLNIPKLMIPPYEDPSASERPTFRYCHLTGNRINLNTPEPLVSPHGSASSTEMPISCLRDSATISLVTVRT
jgi:hypothetical protein